MIEAARTPASTAFVICGALGKEVKDIVDRRGWDVDIYGVSALLHLYPGRIVEELREKLHALKPRYERLVVVYGDCGTTGRLEPILEEVGAVRVPGPHCYEMLAGEELFARVSDERPGTFFLTDWLVRNFDRTVVRGLGLDRYPELKTMLFGNYEAVVFLRQVPNPRLAVKAQEVAAYLELPLEVVDVGLGELETRLAELVEGNRPGVRHLPAVELVEDTPPPRFVPTRNPHAGSDLPTGRGGEQWPSIR